MQLSHTLPVVSATFDDPNLVSAAGLVPLMTLAEEAGLHALGDEHLSLPTEQEAAEAQARRPVAAPDDADLV